MSGEWVGKQSVLLPRTAPNIVEDQGNSPGIPAQIGRHDTGHKIAGKIIRCLLRHLDSLSSGAKKDELAWLSPVISKELDEEQRADLNRCLPLNHKWHF